MSTLTDCGLPGIKNIPYGVHMCQFFKGREDLVAALVPYFAAGLRNRERCIWITAEPLSAAEARAELRKTGLDVDRAIDRGALVLHDFSVWYAHQAHLKGTAVIDVWLAEEKRAKHELPHATDLPLFMEYEEAVSHAFAGRRIVTLCTYHLDACGAAEVLDVAQRHSCTLERPDQGWQIVTAR